MTTNNRESTNDDEKYNGLSRDLAEERLVKPFFAARYCLDLELRKVEEWDKDKLSVLTDLRDNMSAEICYDKSTSAFYRLDSKGDKISVQFEAIDALTNDIRATLSLSDN